MRTLGVVLATCLVTLSICDEDPFIKFAKDFNKIYSTKAEETLRKDIFMEKYNEMVEHNAKYETGEVSWARKTTGNYDRTAEEYAKIRPNGLPQKDKTAKKENRMDDAFEEKLKQMKGSSPNQWSWKDEGGVTSAKNQGQCGSCAAFSATAIIETCFWQQTGILFDDLSEQYILDCAYNYEYQDEDGYWMSADGCDGAWSQVYIDWLINESEGWTQVEGDYPYQGQVRQCRPYQFGWYNKALVSGLHHKWDPTEVEIKDLVYDGPVATSIISTWLDDYSHGVYDDSRCCEGIYDDGCKYETDHSVALVGYGHQNGLDYWLVKNSWGDWWGNDGFMKIKRGTGHCGIGVEMYTAVDCVKN